MPDGLGTQFLVTELVRHCLLIGGSILKYRWQETVLI